MYNVKMQNYKQKNLKDSESFIHIFLKTLSKIGNVLIIAFGAIFFGIRKALFSFKKVSNQKTFKQFVNELNDHLNESATRQTRQRENKVYTPKTIKKNTSTNSNTTKSIPIQEQPIKTSRQPNKYSNKYKPKKSVLLHLVQVIATLVAMGAIVFVIVISVKGLFSKKRDITEQSMINNVGHQSIVDVENYLGYYYFVDNLLLEDKVTSLMIKVYSKELSMLKEYEKEQEELCLDEPLEATPEVEAEVAIEATYTMEPTPEPTTATELNADILIHLNDTNDVVAQIQEKLMDLNYLDSDEPTTFYGAMTEFAMQLFQRGHGLMVDGVVGYDTITLLFSEEAKPYLVRKGDKGWDIKQIQKRLTELGYLDDEKRDGRFDEDTDYAVRVFQGRNKLSQDGIIGHNTTQVLFNGDAKPASNYSAPSSDSGDSGDSGSGSSDGGSYNANDASSFVSYAKSIMNKGYTYIWGGKGPPGMDCSGYVYYCLKQTGNGIGYMTSAAWAQSSYTTISSIHDAKPGDILCFQGHVAICIGDGKMIDSSSSSNAIRIANYETSNYWNSKWICAKRVFG